MSEDYRERIARENAEREALYRGVAAHLDAKDWRLVERPDEEYHCFRFYIQGPGDMTIQLEAAGHHVPRGKVYVSKVYVSVFRWVKDSDGRQVTPSDVNETAPSCNIALDKGYEKIAREIERRFIPELARVMAKIRERVDSRNTFRAGQMKVREQIDATGMVRWWNDRNGSGDGTKANLDWTGAGVEGYGDVTVNSPGSVTLELRSIRPELAVQVLALVKASGKGKG